MRKLDTGRKENSLTPVNHNMHGPIGYMIFIVNGIPFKLVSYASDKYFEIKYRFYLF